MSLDGITDSEVVTASLPFMLYPQLPLSQTQSSQRFPLEQGLCLPMDLSSAVWTLIPTKPAKDRANCDREARNFHFSTIITPHFTGKLCVPFFFFLWNISIPNDAQSCWLLSPV